MFKTLVCQALWLVLLAAPALAVETLSPDASLAVTVDSGGNGRLFYSAARSGTEIIGRSNLGVILDGSDTGQGATIGQVVRESIDEAYPWRGNKSMALNRCNVSRISVVRAGLAHSIELRVYNDGLALRYIFPRGGTVSGEATAFSFPPDSMIWYQDNVRWYEGEYRSCRAAELLPGTVCGVPCTVQLPAQLGYAAVMEGALAHYSGMSLRSTGRGRFQAHFACDSKWTPPGPVVTPWRIVLVARDLNALVNSDIVHNVAPAPDPRLFPQGLQTEWIKPGRCVWSWLCGGGIDVASMEQFATLGRKLGFEYNLIDEDWADARLTDLHGRSVELGSKAWVSATQGYGKTRKNASIVGAPLRFTGRTGRVGTGQATAGDVLSITMSPGGGYLARFTPLAPNASTD